MTEEILVFRKRLLSYSETFIADQGAFLSRYHANFTGYEVDSSGIELLDQASKCILSDYTSHHNWAKFLFRLGLPISSGWLKQLGSLNPALIHAHFLKDGIDAIRLGRHLDTPVITTLHGHDITKYESKPGSKGNNQFFTNVDRVIAVSDYIAQHALAKGCPEKKLVRHSIGIDLERFNQPKNESTEPSLLFVGRLAEKKGCKYLLQAMGSLKNKYPELKLTIVGDGNLAGELKQQATDLQINVDFVGTENARQIRDRLATSWLFVAPSITAQNGDAEGLGMVFLEAQALQTPVVSFRSGGVVEAVEDGETGLLCEEKDVATLADNIDSLLSDSTKRQAMGKQGRKRVENLFDVRKQCKLLELIYDEVSNRA